MVTERSLFLTPKLLPLITELWITGVDPEKLLIPVLLSWIVTFVTVAEELSASFIPSNPEELISQPVIVTVDAISSTMG